MGLSAMSSVLITVAVVTLLVASLACGLTQRGESNSPVTPPSTPALAPESTPVSPAATPAPSPTPEPTPTPAPTPAPTATPVEGPGYGGHFRDPVDDVVYVYLVNPSPEAVRSVTSTHLAPMVYEGMKKIREVRPLQGQYTWRQLLIWDDQLREAGVWDVTGWSTSDVDEGINRIEIGVACESDRERGEREVRAAALRANVPVEAVVVAVQARPTMYGPYQFECAPPESIDPVTGVSTPGFGGMFSEPGTSGSRTLNVYMLEPSQQKAEELAFQIVGQESLDRVSNVRALQGRYTWEQLLEWYRLIDSTGLGVTGAHLTADYMNDRNRLIIEIDTEWNPHVEAEVEDILKQLGIPQESVHLVE